MNSSISDEEYEAAKDTFLASIKEEFTSNDTHDLHASKGSGRTSGTSVVTTSKYESIKKYLQQIEEAESIQDDLSRIEAMKVANKNGLTHWKSKYRLKDTEEGMVVETIGDINSSLLLCSFK